MEGSSGERLGAYGLSFRVAGDASRWLVPAPGDWPVLEVASRAGAPAHEGTGVGFFGDHEARVVLATGDVVELTREPLRATFGRTFPPAHLALGHPYLTPAAAVASTWLDRPSFHAGALVSDDGVWGVFGSRGGGKSSLLAALARAGRAVFTDDLLVVEDGRAFAGPRSVDLRRDAALVLGLGDDLGVVGQRERWRVPVEPVPAELPLRGAVHLEWGEEVGVAAVPASERLARLAAHVALDVQAGGFAAQLLELASLPAVVIRRPRNWESVDESMELLVRTLSGLGRPAQVAAC